ncbi:MAG: HGGxSTG domain-containing protein [Gammaproteobacteria bacterium]|nr:HGGxSTG domain-containing protein [Gammaproteobacteria bacterium]
MKNEINPMQREKYPFLNSPRCGAKTRKGTACQAPAVLEKKRCRMHGGSKGSGARRGNQNALKHGNYTKTVKNIRQAIRCTIKESIISTEEIIALLR